MQREQQYTGPWCVSAAQLRTSKKTKGAGAGKQPQWWDMSPEAAEPVTWGLAAFTLRKEGDHCRAMTRDRRVASVFDSENCQIHREVAVTI